MASTFVFMREVLLGLLNDLRYLHILTIYSPIICVEADITPILEK